MMTMMMMTIIIKMKVMVIMKSRGMITGDLASCRAVHDTAGGSIIILVVISIIICLIIIIRVIIVAIFIFCIIFVSSSSPRLTL